MPNVSIDAMKITSVDAIDFIVRVNNEFFEIVLAVVKVSDMAPYMIKLSSLLYGRVRELKV